MSAHKISICLLMGLLLNACGFEPLYGPSATSCLTVRENLAQVKVARIKDRQGQILRNHLVDLFTPCGQPTFPAATLEVNLSTVQNPISVRRDGTTSRYQLILTAGLKLSDPTTQQVLYQGTEKVVNAYYISESSSAQAYATIVAERDAAEKALKLLADNIHLAISNYYKQKMITCDENPKAP